MLKPITTTLLLTLLASASLISTDSYAQSKSGQRVPTTDLVEGIKSRDGRWFEVEMIVFERFDNQDFREVFDNEINILEKARKWDLLREQLQPDITYLLSGLPECHQTLNPLIINEVQAPVSPAVFYQQMMDYQDLANGKWQFTNELCLLPDESQSGYWSYSSELNKLNADELTHVPLDEVPEQVIAGDHDDLHDVYLLAEQNLELKEQFYTLKRNRNLNPILHIGWRQPGLSRRKSIPLYLVAGENYSEQYQYDGSEIIDVKKQSEIDDIDTSVDFSLEQSAPNLLNTDVTSNVNRFVQQLQSGAVVDFHKNALIYPDETNLPKQTWQLDGFIQIHLNHYLFINAEFNFREPRTELLDPSKFLPTDEPLSAHENQQIVQNNRPSTPSTELDQSPEELIEVNYLQNYYFKQNRRVYSGDIHYLDHPKFGILIQVRKYRH